MRNITYRIIIEPDTKGFHGYVPALVGCHTWGKTVEETRHHVQEAIDVYVESLIDRGESIPQEFGFETFETVHIPEQRRVSKSHVKRQYA